MGWVTSGSLMDKIGGELHNNSCAIQKTLDQINADKSAVSGYKAKIDGELKKIGLAAENLGKEFSNSMSAIQEHQQAIESYGKNVANLLTSSRELTSEYTQWGRLLRLGWFSGRTLKSMSLANRNSVVLDSAKALTSKLTAELELGKAMTIINQHVEAQAQAQAQKTRENRAVMPQLVPVSEYILDSATEQRRLDQNALDRFRARLEL